MYNSLGLAFGYGAVAQLGERNVRNVEAVGSIPICSIKIEYHRICARWGVSGALLPGIRSTGIEFPPEGLAVELFRQASGVDGRVLYNRSL